jgi:hypothetical protein
MAKMSVGELVPRIGDCSLDEMFYRVAIANDLGMTLDELDELPAPELADWLLLYSVEAEAEAQRARNAEHKEEG